MPGAILALSYATGGAAAVGAWFARIKPRLELSRAKHRSVTGHARMARRIAGQIPFYDYQDNRFFDCDDAPAEIAARRRAGFDRLAALYRARFPKTAALTAEARTGISDLQFTGRYRVPFQFSRFVRQHLSLRGLSSLRRRASRSPISTAMRFLRPDGFVRRQSVWPRFLQGSCIDRREPHCVAGAGAGAGRLSSRPGRGQRGAAASAISASGRGVVPHVGNRGGDAGGAAGPLPHRTVASCSLLRCLSWLVGRRAARRRQPHSRRAITPTRWPRCPNAR